MSEENKERAKFMAQIALSQTEDVKKEETISSITIMALLNSAVLLATLSTVMALIWWNTQGSPVQFLWIGVAAILVCNNVACAIMVWKYHKNRIKEILTHRTMTLQLKDAYERGEIE